MTFGGAYAVLPFVADQAVNRFGWLTPEEMIADDRPDWIVIGLAIAAFVAVWRFRVSVLPVVGICALVGLATGVIA